MKRGKDETFENYQIRRKAVNIATKLKLKGTYLVRHKSYVEVMAERGLAEQEKKKRERVVTESKI